MKRQLITVDCEYVHAQYAASFLLVEGKQAAFVENNTAHAVPVLLETIHKAGLTPAQVEYVVITHVHLDHAGGSSALMAACPNATLLAHPRAARHIKDPSRLIAGACAVYGKERFDQLYGEILPVPASRVREMADEEVLQWGSRQWTFLHTRGHANHHMCLRDSALEAVFTGDAFGVAYPTLQGNDPFIFPSTSPTDFDSVAAIESVNRLANLGVDKALLTHFGEVTDLKARARDLVEWLEFSQSVVDQARGLGDGREQYCQRAVDTRFKAELERRGQMTATHWELLRIDRELNAAGLAYRAKSLE